MAAKEDPWEGYNPDAPLQEPVSDEQLAKAAEKMAKPKRGPPLLSYLALPLVFLWGLGHLYILYMMMGTPLAGSVFLIVLVNLLFLSHYSVLLIVNIGRWRQGKWA